MAAVAYAAARERPTTAPQAIRNPTTARIRSEYACASCPIVRHLSAPTRSAQAPMPIVRYETVENSATTRTTAAANARPRRSQPSRPESLMRRGKSREAASARPADPLLASFAASGTASAPRSGSANDPPNGVWAAPPQDVGDLDHIRPLP